jgi:hypothetical protein
MGEEKEKHDGQEIVGPVEQRRHFLIASNVICDVLANNQGYDGGA